jgi:hypothetical protein
MPTPWDLEPIDLPDTVSGDDSTFQLPVALQRGMRDAWNDSFPGGSSQEQGGMLVRTASGALEWRRGAAGNTGSFSMNYGDLKSGETLVASAHTHPYDATEGGHTDVPFSGADIGNMALSSRPEDMKLVRSGDSVFMIKETQGFKDYVTDKGEGTARAEMIKSWDDAFKNATGTFAERNDAAVKAVCNTYHLEYYSGKGDSLARVDVTK